MSNETKFGSRFLQASLVQKLRMKGAYEMLYRSLSIEDIDKLVEQNVYFAICYSPASILELSNVPSSDIMYLITFENNYLLKFLPEVIVGIILHEIGHAFNPKIMNLEGEIVADAFAKAKGYSKWIIYELEEALKNNLIGFDEAVCNKRILRLMEK